MAVKKTSVLPIETGLYLLSDIGSVIKGVAEGEIAVGITLPKLWAKDNCPILSPKALKFIDLTAAPDSDFLVPLTFVVERGKKKYNWKQRAVTK